MKPDHPFYWYMVFFKPEILDEFNKHPYEIRWQTSRYGQIIKKGRDGSIIWYLSFGVTPQGLVHFSLEDIDELATIDDPIIRLSEDERDIFKKYWVYPDSLSPDFIRVEIEGKPLSTLS